MASTAVNVPQVGGAGREPDRAGGYSGEHPTSTGIDNKKMIMWWYLGSDCTLFASLIATYFMYRNQAQNLETPPYPTELIDVPYTSVSAGVLLFSSFTMVMAVLATSKGDIRGFRVWSATTAILGTIFLGGQFFEFTSFYHEGLTLQGSIFGASFFTLTGVHGLHVSIGVLWLISLFIVSLRGGISQKDATNVEVMGLYWHFVDIVWIIIFTLVYLVPYKDAPEGTEQAAEGAFSFLQSLPFF